MKRKRLDYARWDCIRSRTLKHKHVHTPYFTGCVDLLDIHEADQPQIWHFNNEDITICDTGIKWLTIMPDHDWYCISAMFNERNELQFWYIDMIEEHGVDPDGVPYYYDLYLDLIVYPDGSSLQDDMDELEQALQNDEITREQFDLAINTCRRLQNRISSGLEDFRNFTNDMLALIIN